MTLWSTIASRPDLLQEMEAYYAEKFQREIRFVFASWIENKIMIENQANGGTFESIALDFIEGLQREIQNYMTTDPNLKYRLEEISKTFNQFSPTEFYTHLRTGIERELALARMYDEPGLMIRTKIEELKNRIIYMKQEIQQFRLVCENMVIQYREYSARENLLPSMNAQQRQELMVIKETLEKDFRSIGLNNASLVANYKKLVENYKQVQSNVVDEELKNWQRNQALAGNGAPFKDNLDEIQSWIEDLVQIICDIRNHITSLLATISQCPFNFDNSELNNLLKESTSEQERLILSAFIVEKQPPQVMKTNTRFTSTVRWLIGPQFGISMATPTVECMILSESQAQRHCAQKQMNDSNPNSSGELLNNVSSLELQQNRHFSASFRNMQLKKIKRTEKKGTESVMDEKFTLLFFTTSIVNDYRIRAWTLSLPVVVIVHGNQEPQSWATITWDNAFSKINREPFEVPDRVPWNQLSYALNTKFCSSTGRYLTRENLQFLYEKIFRGETMSDEKTFITWALFCKEPLPERTFTFWDWFFAIMKLTREHLSGPWRDGCIIGFVNKRKTNEEYLNNCPEGTFLLRFSDSELGGITIAWVGEGNQTFMLQPWTAKDFAVRSLADRIQDLPHLVYLYPNINKNDAFNKFYSPVTEEARANNGYVKNIIRACVPSINPSCSYPNTPQHSMQSPGPSSRDLQSLAGSDTLFADNTIDFDEFI